MKKRLLVGLGTVVVVALIGWAALRQPSAQPTPPPPPPTPSPAPATTASGEFPTVPRIPLAEARQMVREAIAGYIEGLIQAGDPVPSEDFECEPLKEVLEIEVPA